MLFGGLMMLLAGTLVGEWPRVHLEGRGLWALIYLMVVGSIGGFVSYIYALQHLPVATVSLYAYANPLIAVALGALVAGRAVHDAHGRRDGDRVCRHGDGARAEARRAEVAGRAACVRRSADERTGVAHDPSLPGRLPRSRPTPTGWGFFLCTDKSVRTGRGGDYLALTLADATGEVVARVFDNVDRLREEFDAGEFVKVQGRANLHNGRLQFLVENIRRVMAGPDSQDRRDGFREDTLVPSAPRPVDEMWRELQQVVAAVRQRAPQRAADADRRRARSARCASGRRLASSITPIAAGSSSTSSRWPRPAGCSPCSTAPTPTWSSPAPSCTTSASCRSCEYDTATTYTRDGNMIGHITLGSIMVHDACRAIAGFPDALRAQVLHLIGSHHGERALGSPVEPLSIEAFILSAVDDLDATINQVRRAIRDDDGSGEFTGYQSRLGRVLWKGDTT